MHVYIDQNHELVTSVNRLDLRRRGIYLRYLGRVSRMETSGYVLVCESFEFDHDYEVIAFSKDSKSLTDYKEALESCAARGHKGNMTFNRSYYVKSIRECF